MRDRVSERSKAINAMLSDAIVRALDGDTLVLTHPAVTLVKRLSEQRNADVIREALKDALGVRYLKSLGRYQTSGVELLSHQRDVVSEKFTVDTVPFAVMPKNRPTGRMRTHRNVDVLIHGRKSLHGQLVT